MSNFRRPKRKAGVNTQWIRLNKSSYELGPDCWNMNMKSQDTSEYGEMFKMKDSLSLASILKRWARRNGIPK